MQPNSPWVDAVLFPFHCCFCAPPAPRTPPASSSPSIDLKKKGTVGGRKPAFPRGPAPICPAQTQTREQPRHVPDHYDGRALQGAVLLPRRVHAHAHTHAHARAAAASPDFCNLSLDIHCLSLPSLLPFLHRSLPVLDQPASPSQFTFFFAPFH